MWPITSLELSELFQQEVPGGTFSGLSLDSRTTQEMDIFFCIPGENVDPHDFLDTILNIPNTIAIVQKKPFESERLIRVEDTLHALRKFTAFFRRRCSWPFIGVGGSNGKTSTKELIHALLGYHHITKTKKSQNGFLGIPLSVCQREHTTLNPPKAAVIEIGIDELGAMTEHVKVVMPNLVCLTLLEAEHLTKLESLEKAQDEELKLFYESKAQRVWQTCDARLKKEFLLHGNPNDLFVTDDQGFEPHRKGRIFLSSFEVLGDELQVSLFYKEQTSTFHFVSSGYHQAKNFAVAYGMALLCNKTSLEMEEGLRHFKSPEFRSEVIHLPYDNILYNDCYNASPASVKAALETLIQDPRSQHKSKIMILGDMLDLGTESKFWHKRLAEDLISVGEADLFLYGDCMYDCYKALESMQTKLRIAWIPRQEDPLSLVERLPRTLKDTAVLVKGSRGLKLERISQAIQTKYQSS